MNRLRWKLFGTHILIGIIPLMFFSYTISNMVETHYIEKEYKDLIFVANTVSSLVQKLNLSEKSSKDQAQTTIINEKAKEYAARIIVVDKDSRILLDSSNNQKTILFYPPVVLIALDKQENHAISSDRMEISVAVPILGEDDEVIGAVTMAKTLTELNSLITEVTQRATLLVLLLSMIVLLLVIFISALIIDPLKNILKSVNIISEGRLDHRINMPGHDEFTELATAFNEMTTQLENVESSRQEFVSNVSHELKTPLSSIKVLSESLLLQGDAPAEMYREFLQDINSEVDRMADIINELLTLVKMDRLENEMNIKQVKINKMLEDIVKRLTPIATIKQISLIYDEIKQVTIEADELKLCLAISNVIENAIKYTDDEGVIRIIVDSDHQHAFITVIDNGIGISEEEQSKIFTRFYRVDKTRARETGGTGLGLAITHKTVLMHKGNIKVTSKDNEGSTFVIRLPIHSNL